MIKLSTPLRFDGPVMLRNLAWLALAAGAGVWGALLFAPVPQPLPPMLESAAASRQDTEPVARWFGGGALRVRVNAMGLITAGDGRGAALLAVNGGPPQAYRVGQALAPGVTLAAVGPGAVSIDQDGVVEEVALRANPAHLVQGFIPVPAAASPARR